MRTSIPSSLGLCAIAALAACTQVNTIERASMRSDIAAKPVESVESEVAEKAEPGAVDASTKASTEVVPAAKKPEVRQDNAQGSSIKLQLTDDERAMFSDASFRKRFVRGLSCRDRHRAAALTEDERKSAIEVFDLIGEDKLEAAETLARQIYSDDASASIHFTVAHVPRGSAGRSTKR